MKRHLNTLCAWLGGLALALLASMGGLLDSLTGTSATLWIVAAVCTAVIVVFGVLFFMSTHEINQADPCRTADARVMAKDVRKLQRQVPDPRHPPYRPPGVVSLNAAYQANLRQAEASGTAAALLDMARGTQTPNPRPAGTRAAIVWFAAYQRTLLDAPVHARARQAGERV